MTMIGEQACASSARPDRSAVHRAFLKGTSGWPITMPACAAHHEVVRFQDKTSSALREIVGQGQLPQHLRRGTVLERHEFRLGNHQLHRQRIGNSPPLNIQRFGASVVLSWTNAAFGLQSARTISATLISATSATSQYTNSISVGQRFCPLA